MPIAGFEVLTENHSRDILGNYSTVDTDITSATSVDGFGSWIELIADIGDRDIMIVSIAIWLRIVAAQSKKTELEIGTGVATSEVREFGLSFSTRVLGDFAYFKINRQISANARLSARFRDNTTEANPWSVSVTYIKL